MSLSVDARGLACPQPVILTRNAMREADHVMTLVSQSDQVDNVRRLGERAGWQVTVTEAKAGWAVELVKGQGADEPEATPDLTACPTPGQGRVVVVASDEFGRGERELGQILMGAFFYSLREIDLRPDTLIFLNNGARLAIEGSPVLDDLKALEQDGVQILVCGTCLDYFQLREQAAVGIVSNMYTIAETIMGAGHTTFL